MSGLRAGASGSGLRAGAGGSGVSSFGLLTEIGWLHAYWAEGPEFQALGKADAATVTTWPDEIGTLNLTNASSDITYRAASSNLGNQPALRSPGTNSTASKLQTANETATNATWSIVVVAQDGGSATTNNFIVDGPATGTRHYIQGSTDGWHIANATDRGPAPYATYSLANRHLHVVRYSSSAARWEIDGATIVSTGSSGTPSFAGLTAFARFTGGVGVAQDIAFIGIYVGDIFAHAKFAELESFLATKYGITLS